MNILLKSEVISRFTRKSMTINIFDLHTFNVRSQDRVVGIVTGYGMDDRGVGARVPVGEEFSLLRVVQTGSGAHPTSYQMGNGGSFPGGKAAEV
jgi:hypothetical protein